MIEDENEVDFESFLAAVESKEQDQAQNNSNQKGFEFPKCAQVGNRAIVRFVKGIAETSFDKDKAGSGRAKLYNVGWVKDDAGKAFPLVLPAIVKNVPQMESTFLKFVDKVLTRVWVDNPDPSKKGSWNYIYSERDDYGQQQSGEMTLKEIFWNVFKSGKKETDMYYNSARSWRGQTVYVANVIDRMDYKWHQENKKTKLLMRSVKLNGDKVNHKEISLYAIGSALGELADNHGTKLDYDVLILPGPEAKDKFSLKNVSKLKEINYWDDVKFLTDEERNAISVTKGFTDEEKSWEVIDIDKYYRYTSAGLILKHFGKTIRNFDMMVGTNFYDELKAEADADAAFKKSQQTATESAPANEAPVAPQATAQVTQPVASQPTAAPVQPQPVTQVTPTPQPAATQPVAPQAPVQSAPQSAPSFDTMSPAGKPEPMPVTDEARASISSFYDSLED